MQEIYDLIIVGGGVTGAALLYAASRYTNINKMLLLEKYDGLATLNSNSINNAQTLHFGDIETNYSLADVKQVKKSAELLLRYIFTLDKKSKISVIKRCQKMVLGVEDVEIDALQKTYSRIHDIFPNLRLIKKTQIAKYEPNVVKGRDTDGNLIALFSEKGYMVDFGALTNSFVYNAKKTKNKKVDIRFGTKALDVFREDTGTFRVITNKGEYLTRFVVFATGVYSLHFAKSMGYYKNLLLWPVAGTFYYSKRVLNGKVYRVQIGGVPFAAVHGDPDITNPNVTRFGPTVTLPLAVETGREGTFANYLKDFDFSLGTIESLRKIVFDKDIEKILLKNLSYGLPFIGKRLFLENEVAKIVPSLKGNVNNIWLAKGVGGIRPQVIDKARRALAWGEVKLEKDGVIFNTNPSPGATSCLRNALEDVRIITKYLDKEFYEEQFRKDLIL